MMCNTEDTKQQQEAAAAAAAQEVESESMAVSSLSEPIIHPTSLEGLLRLRQGGLLRHDVNLVEDQQHLCSAWSNAIGFEQEEPPNSAAATTTTTTTSRMVVSHLDLGGCRLHRGLPDGMLFVLKQYFAPTLTSLNLGGTDLPIAETLSVLQSLEKLQSLHLGANGLGNDGVMALVPWLATASHLTIVDLRYNDIGPVGCESLCKGLRQQKEFLKLQQESTSNTTTTTTTARTNRGVAKLYLEGNNVQDAGAIALATHYPLAEAGQVLDYQQNTLQIIFGGQSHTCRRGGCLY